jgi:MFS family permease
VLALGAGPGEIGTLAAVQTLPFLLLAIPLGVVADRASRRRLMLAAEALRALSLLALLAMVVSGQLSIAGLAVLGFIGAVGTVGFSVAAPALVPALVPAAMLGRANGQLELARSAAYAGGPALAGALVAWAGASSAFVLAAVLSGGAVALLWRLVEPPRAAAPPRHPLLEIRDGALFVWRQDFLRPMLLTGVAWNISWFVLQAAYVPYAVRVLGLGAQAVGITLGTYGAGMVVGALLASRVLAAIPSAAPSSSARRCRCWPPRRWWPRCSCRRACWRRCRSSSAAAGRSSGPSRPPRCGKVSRPVPCWAARRRSS